MSSLDGPGLLSTGVLCFYLFTIFLGSLGGIFGAMRAMKEGAPNPGPAFVATGFGLFALVAVVESLLQVSTLSDSMRGGTALSWFYRLSMLIDLAATAAVLVGIALLHPGAKRAAEAG